MIIIVIFFGKKCVQDSITFSPRNKQKHIKHVIYKINANLTTDRIIVCANLENGFFIDFFGFQIMYTISTKNGVSYDLVGFLRYKNYREKNFKKLIRHFQKVHLPPGFLAVSRANIPICQRHITESTQNKLKDI